MVSKYKSLGHRKKRKKKNKRTHAYMSSLSIREKIKFAIESQTKQYIKQNFTLIVPIQLIFFVVYI